MVTFTEEILNGNFVFCALKIVISFRCVKSVHIRSLSSLYSVRIWGNMNQKKSDTFHAVKWLAIAKNILSDHLFSKYARFSEKITVFAP